MTRTCGTFVHSRRVGALVATTLATALLLPGAAVAAEPLPPGALPVVEPVGVPGRVLELLRRLPAVRPAAVGPATNLGGPFVVSTSGVVAGSTVGTSWDDFQAYRWRDGVVTEFPAGPGERSQAVAVNASGLVAVSVYRGDVGPLPYLWHPDGTVEALPLETEWGSVTDVADDGVAVGVTTMRTPAPGSEGYTAVMWRDGQLHDLAPGGFDAVAWDVNERGAVVGGTSRLDNTAWVWRDGVVTDLPAPPGLTSTTADQVNDRGDVRGGVRIPQVAPGTQIGAVWFGGTELRHLGAGPGWLVDLNEKGLAAGNLWRGGTMPGDEEPWVVDAVTMDRHRVTRLRTTSGGPSSASALNDLGIVVGDEVREGRRQAVAWVLGLPVPLGGPAGSPVVESRATGIDERGRVVGWVRLPGDTDTSQGRAVVWDLVPTRQQVGRWLS